MFRPALLIFNGIAGIPRQIPKYICYNPFLEACLSRKHIADYFETYVPTHCGHWPIIYVA